MFLMLVTIVKKNYKSKLTKFEKAKPQKKNFNLWKWKFG